MAVESVQNFSSSRRSLGLKPRVHPLKDRDLFMLSFLNEWFPCCFIHSNRLDHENTQPTQSPPLPKNNCRRCRTAPMLLPSRLCSAESAPSGRLAMGFIGVGTQGRGLFGGFLGLDTRVLAVCDVDTTRRNDAKERVDKH